MRRSAGRPAPWSLAEVTQAYDIREQVGEGVYGQVHKALSRSSGCVVALKKIKSDASSDREGFPITALREIQILLELRHACVVDLKGVCLGSSDGLNSERAVFLAFEYLEHDLNGLIETAGAGLTDDHICCYARQLVDGVAHMHERGYLHRDIKASNLLISAESGLKIADWGLARKYDETAVAARYTNRVITLWYRPPELLLGATRCDDGYTAAIDVWSVGCILAELLHRKPILPGNTETEQLTLIFDLLGTPTPAEWPGVERLPLWDTFAPVSDSDSDSESPRGPLKKPRRLRERFEKFEASALDLVDAVLVYAPQTRLTAKAALQHRYFAKAKRPHELPPLRVSSAHEWSVRKARRATQPAPVPVAVPVAVPEEPRPPAAAPNRGRSLCSSSGLPESAGHQHSRSGPTVPGPGLALRSFNDQHALSWPAPTEGPLFSHQPHLQPHSWTGPQCHAPQQWTGSHLPYGNYEPRAVSHFAPHHPEFPRAYLAPPPYAFPEFARAAAEPPPRGFCEEYAHTGRCSNPHCPLAHGCTALRVPAAAIYAPLARCVPPSQQPHARSRCDARTSAQQQQQQQQQQPVRSKEPLPSPPARGPQQQQRAPARAPERAVTSHPRCDDDDDDDLDHGRRERRRRSRTRSHDRDRDRRRKAAPTRDEQHRADRSNRDADKRRTDDADRDRDRDRRHKDRTQSRRPDKPRDADRDRDRDRGGRHRRPS